MKLPAFRQDPASGLKKAQAALAAAEARIVELESDRLTALAESDDVSIVHSVDLRLVGERQTAATLVDRIAVLRAAVRAQHIEAANKLHQAGLAIISERLEKRVGLARELDGILRQFEDIWRQLIDRSPVITNWPPGLPLPRAEDLLDIKPLRDELSWRLYACGRPSWNRVCSVPQPKPAVGVAGLEPKGLVGATEAMGLGLLARLRMQGPISTNEDEEATAA
jgi:hypothetical protein